ncbi:hypothetical protein J25TS5_12210 [Paenibacillus faecis]|uniref:hypothetical protein n=1 Tax=Paenibacillus faecis TaxID=862114 RepID=UPI001B258135|nr:hypothetical protein [Paenibacillus faecis]GIO84289.1 hypothetical protein J25TS5_12210 [Paenibacillus faecis]
MHLFSHLGADRLKYLQICIFLKLEMWKCGNVEMWKCGNVEMLEMLEVLEVLEV